VFLTTLLVTLLVSAVPVSAQQDEKGKLPKKGDHLVIKGCLRGNAVEQAEAMFLDEDGDPRQQDAQLPIFTYRLEGDKKLLKDLKTKHDRMVVEVKGVLRSDLSPGGLGTTVGRTRINIGVDPASSRGAQQPVPVLEARSFEGSTVSCAK